MKSRWGESFLKLQRQDCEGCGKSCLLLPEGLDGSGLSPRALECASDLCVRLPYREAQTALSIQGLCLEVSHCERLTQSYAEVAYKQVCEDFTTLAKQPLISLSCPKARLHVVQADGVMVLEKDKPSKGLCEGREVKQMLIYPLEKPNARSSIANSDPEQFHILAHGLVRHAGVAQEDILIGLADGSTWIDSLFEELGVTVRILDVYHATLYQDIVMKALGWDEDKRLAERCSWLRGDINAAVWCKAYVPQDPHVQLSWSDEARSALAYLDKRLNQMNYFDCKELGYPIGSGQIEGANKSVIGARMKRGGMRWSHKGINRMAILRSQQCSVKPLFDFQQIRLAAFPVPHF